MPRIESPKNTPVDLISEVHAIKIARALADPTRFFIYRNIIDADEMRCGDICMETPVRASTVSHHLKVLSDAGLIKSRRMGLGVYYRPVPEILEAYLQFLRKLRYGRKMSSIRTPTTDQEAK